MPSSSLSPNPNSSTTNGISPRNNAAAAEYNRSVRPPAMRRQSSQTQALLSRQQMASPGSSDGLAPRHHIKPRHAKIVLPRNQSASGRNLTKLARQAYNNVEDQRKHARQRSHEGDTEIRLPGSLEERPPPMRRNMTATQLPRTTSNAKLKKNLSHGQLSRLAPGKGVTSVGSTSHKAPPSPGLKGRSKRPQSMDVTALVKNYDDYSEEDARGKGKGQQKRAVGFAVGSGNDSSDGENPEMEGSGLQEDEWTEESASVSPYSTRQNTANNSRRASVSERPADRKPSVSSPLKERPSNIATDTSGEDTDTGQLPTIRSVQLAAADETATSFHQEKEPVGAPRAVERSPLHLAKDLPNPATRHVLNKGYQLPAPALVTAVTTLDDNHSTRASPVASLRSSRSNIAEASNSGEHDDPEELISRFVPGTSNPSTGSGGNTVSSTPRESGMQTPDEREHHLSSHPLSSHRDKGASSFQLGLASPGSTVSAGSGAVTPATAQSRTELRMAQEKASADAESAGQRQPTLPVYKYDRRNETLKTYLSNWTTLSGEQKNALTAHYGTARGSAIFQGRFRAVNTELRVVQKYRDPVGESIARLKACKAVKWPHQPHRSAPPARQPAAALPTSRSATALPVRQHSTLSKSSSPPLHPSPLKRAMATSNQQPSQQQGPGQSHIQFAPAPAATVGSVGGGGSERQKTRREVSFAAAPPETREFELELAPGVIASQLWQGIDVE